MSNDFYKNRCILGFYRFHSEYVTHKEDDNSKIKIKRTRAKNNKNCVNIRTQAIYADSEGFDTTKNFPVKSNG